MFRVRSLLVSVGRKASQFLSFLLCLFFPEETYPLRKALFSTAKAGR